MPPQRIPRGGQLSLIDGFPAEAGASSTRATPPASWAAARGAHKRSGHAARSPRDRKSLNASADAAEAKDAKTLSRGFQPVLNAIRAGLR